MSEHYLFITDDPEVVTKHQHRYPLRIPHVTLPTLYATLSKSSVRLSPTLKPESQARLFETMAEAVEEMGRVMWLEMMCLPPNYPDTTPDSRTREEMLYVNPDGPFKLYGWKWA